MGSTLGRDVLALIDDPGTIKLLVTTGVDGCPHAVVKQLIHAGEDGNIHILELLESSATNANLTRAIWFDRKVSIVLGHEDGRSVQIKGKPVRNIITGPVFSHHYRKVREELGDVDLAGVWVVSPEEVIDQSFATRKAAEERAHPDFVHLDRLARS